MNKFDCQLVQKFLAAVNFGTVENRMYLFYIFQ